MNDEQPSRQEDDGEPVRPVHPNGQSGLAAYRWLLRRLFADDMTPPPAENGSRVPIQRVIMTRSGETPSPAWNALWDRLLAPPPTEPDEGE